MNLFIDFDGTLCSDKFWRSLESDLGERLQQSLFLLDKKRVKEWMLGMHSSEDINRKLASDLNVDYAYLWDIFVKDCRSMRIEPGCLEKIGKRRKEYDRLILITDNMDCFDRFTVPSLGLKNYFDLIMDSSKEGVFKYTGDLFKRTEEKAGIKISESILIDNSPKACEAFEGLGGKSFLVTKDRALSYWLDNISYPHIAS